MATPRRLDPSDDSVGGFNDLDNSVVQRQDAGWASVRSQTHRRSLSGCASHTMAEEMPRDDI
jgi:hypothetical protein